jgi:GNAT superfamily N-acetyltransferase
MEYELFLKYNESMSIGLHGHWGNLCKHTWADIMHWTGETDDEINDEENEGTKIGLMTWITYNQALAKVHNVNMTHVAILKMLQGNRKALPDLDYINISQETIEAIGVTSNPNIVILIHFGISADYRNKGLGEEVLKGFIEQMLGKCGYIVIVHNEPAQFGKLNGPDSLYAKQGVELDSLEKDHEKAQWKLNAFWQRCGFRQFKDYENVFICNVEQTVSELLKAKEPAI